LNLYDETTFTTGSITIETIQEICGPPALKLLNVMACSLQTKFTDFFKSMTMETKVLI
jgi:hypothetical protein